MPLIVVVVALNFACKYQERKHKTIVDLLEKGLPVPRELLRSPQRTGSALMRALTLRGRGRRHLRLPGRAVRVSTTACGPAG